MNKDELEVCDACGVTAEFGYMITEGDDIAEVTIFSGDRETAIREFQAYALLANEINTNFTHDLNLESEFEFTPLKIRFKFDCSAEKIIFELRSRSLLK